MNWRERRRVSKRRCRNHGGLPLNGGYFLYAEIVWVCVGVCVFSIPADPAIRSIINHTSSFALNTKPLCSQLHWHDESSWKSRLKLSWQANAATQAKHVGDSLVLNNSEPICWVLTAKHVYININNITSLKYKRYTSVLNTAFTAASLHTLCITRI